MKGEKLWVVSSLPVVLYCSDYGVWTSVCESCFVLLCVSQGVSKEAMKGICVLRGDGPVKGVVRLNQEGEGAPTELLIQLEGVLSCFHYTREL